MIESKLIPNALFADKNVKSVDKLKEFTGIEYIASMNQTHSDLVDFVESPRVYNSDGIYTEDPELNDKAIKLDSLSFEEALRLNLKIMDTTAFTLSKENNLPIIVFDMNIKGNLKRVVQGEKIGTKVFL